MSIHKQEKKIEPDSHMLDPFGYWNMKRKLNRRILSQQSFRHLPWSNVTQCYYILDYCNRLQFYAGNHKQKPRIDKVRAVAPKGSLKIFFFSIASKLIDVQGRLDSALCNSSATITTHARRKVPKMCPTLLLCSVYLKVQMEDEDKQRGLEGFIEYLLKGLKAENQLCVTRSIKFLLFVAQSKLFQLLTQELIAAG
jgi:hypothetical protein